MGFARDGVELEGEMDCFDWRIRAREIHECNIFVVELGIEKRIPLLDIFEGVHQGGCLHGKYIRLINSTRFRQEP